jgi:ketosteroid isomerase-like protein
LRYWNVKVSFPVEEALFPVEFTTHAAGVVTLLRSLGKERGNTAMVKRIVFLGLALFFFAPGINSQNPCDRTDPNCIPPNPELRRQEVVNLERETVRAILQNNGTFFRRVYSDDFAGTLSHGQMVDKNHFINEVQSGGSKYESFNASDIQVRFFQETAVATSLWTLRAIFNGQQIETQMRVMHVYINGPRGWHVVAGQNTPMPPYTPHPL